jgi:uncharacterized protein YcfL
MTSIRLIKRAALAAFACTALFACASQNGTQNVITGKEGDHKEDVVVGNSYLAAYLTTTSHKSKRLDDGRLMVQFELHNEQQQHVKFAWAIDWYDAQGFHIADATRHWEPVTLGGGGFIPIQITAPTVSATTYKLQVQSPDEVR